MKITWDVIVESSLDGQPSYILAWGNWLHQWLGEPSYINMAWATWLHRRQCGIVHQQSSVLSEPPA